MVFIIAKLSFLTAAARVFANLDGMVEFADHNASLPSSVQSDTSTTSSATTSKSGQTEQDQHYWIPWAVLGGIAVLALAIGTILFLVARKQKRDREKALISSATAAKMELTTTMDVTTARGESIAPMEAGMWAQQTAVEPTKSAKTPAQTPSAPEPKSAAVESQLKTAQLSTQKTSPSAPAGKSAVGDSQLKTAHSTTSTTGKSAVTAKSAKSAVSGDTKPATNGTSTK